LSTKVIRENQTVALEDLNTSGMVKNRNLARAISDLGWRTFRDMLTAKSEKYGRALRIIDRWEATSQKCSCCGARGGKQEEDTGCEVSSHSRVVRLDVREWECLFCGAIHDRDLNASKNILNVAVGHTETQNGRGEKVRVSEKKPHLSESSTTFKPRQLTLF
jgi:putative transposase